LKASSVRLFIAQSDIYTKFYDMQMNPGIQPEKEQPIERTRWAAFSKIYDAQSCRVRPLTRTQTTRAQTTRAQTTRAQAATALAAHIDTIEQDRKHGIVLHVALRC
jgi:predicted metalloendopeptidase